MMNKNVKPLVKCQIDGRGRGWPGTGSNRRPSDFQPRGTGVGLCYSVPVRACLPRSDSSQRIRTCRLMLGRSDSSGHVPGTRTRVWFSASGLDIPLEGR
jgi:hypothetical protein